MLPHHMHGITPPPPSIPPYILLHNWSIPKSSLASIPVSSKTHLSVIIFQVSFTPTMCITGYLSMPLINPDIKSLYADHDSFWLVNRSENEATANLRLELDYPKRNIHYCGLTESVLPIPDPPKSLLTTEFTIYLLRFIWHFLGSGLLYLYVIADERACTSRWFDQGTSSMGYPVLKKRYTGWYDPTFSLLVIHNISVRIFLYRKILVNIFTWSSY